MADVFATIVVPASMQAEAIAMAEGHAGFLAGKTTDPNGAPPATHYLASGQMPEEIVQKFRDDARFTVSDQSWRTVCASMGLFGIVEAV